MVREKDGRESMETHLILQTTKHTHNRSSCRKSWSTCARRTGRRVTSVRPARNKNARLKVSQALINVALSRVPPLRKRRHAIHAPGP